MPESYEAPFHDVGMADFHLDLRSAGPVADALRAPLLDRAIDRPETEGVSHYFHARLADQFDAVVHFDATSAVQSLERVGVPARDERPETHPSAV